MMAFRVGGALESLQEQYYLLNLCFSMVTFDLQAQVHEYSSVQKCGLRLQVERVKTVMAMQDSKFFWLSQVPHIGSTTRVVAAFISGPLMLLLEVVC